MANARTEIQRQDRQIIDLKTELRRFEYHIDLVERAPTNVPEIISNMRKQQSPAYKTLMSNDSSVGVLCKILLSFMTLQLLSMISSVKKELPQPANSLRRSKSLTKKFTFLKRWLLRENKRKSKTYLPLAICQNLLTLSFLMIHYSALHSHYDLKTKLILEPTRVQFLKYFSYLLGGLSASKTGSILKKNDGHATERLSSRTQRSPQGVRTPKSSRAIKFEDQSPIYNNFDNRRSAKDAIEKRIQNLNENILNEVQKVKKQFLS